MEVLSLRTFFNRGFAGHTQKIMGSALFIPSELSWKIEQTQYLLSPTPFVHSLHRLSQANPSSGRSAPFLLVHFNFPSGKC